MTSLTDILQTEALWGRDFLKLGMDICKALEVCSQYNVIHRDIKPDNIFRSDTGDYKLGDFGIARQLEKTMAGLSRKGTFAYMAPEVYHQQSYNETVDIYSLGILLYRLFNNNRTPFLPDYPEPVTYQDKEAADRIRLSGEDMPDPCNADESLSRVIRKACAYKPVDRYQNAAELYSDLEYLYDLNGSMDHDVVCTDVMQNQGTGPEGSGYGSDSSLEGSRNSQEFPVSEQTVGLFSPVTEIPVFEMDDIVQDEESPEQEPDKKSRLPLVIVSVIACCMVAGAAAWAGFLRPYLGKNSRTDTAVAVSASQGRWILESKTEYRGESKNSNLTGEYEYSYDDKGELIREMEKLYPSGETDHDITYEYEYDESGNKTSVRETDTASGVVISVWEMEYDPSGHEVRRENRDGSGNVISREEYQYNSDGRLTGSNRFDQAGEADGSMEIEYGNGAKIRSTLVGKDGTTEAVCEFDKYENLIHEQNFQSGEEVRYFYDNNGNLMRESRYDGTHELEASIEYKYRYMDADAPSAQKGNRQNAQMDKIGTEFKEASYAFDISGIVHYMESKYGGDVMDHSQLYGLPGCNNGYVVQMQDNDVVKYIFIIPDADPDRFAMLGADERFTISSDGGVFYMGKDVHVTAPILPDSIEGVSANGKDLILKTFTLSGYPEFQEGYPALAYILTDGKERVRRVLLMTAGERMVRADVTYDENDRVVKTHGISAAFGSLQWQALGWCPADGNALEASQEDIGSFLKDSILKMPNLFFDVIPDGKQEECKATYRYDDQGKLLEAHDEDRMKQENVDWSFSYGDNGRSKAEKTVSVQSSGVSERKGFVYERNEYGLLVRMTAVEDASMNMSGETQDDVKGMGYSYLEDGTMSAE